MRKTGRGQSWLPLAAIVVLMVGAPKPSLGQAAPAQAKSAQSDCVVWESLAGDVYEPGRWRPLGWRTLFLEGWDEPWASPPNGEGGAPRQGWLNAYDGVFYRLSSPNGSRPASGTRQPTRNRSAVRSSGFS